MPPLSAGRILVNPDALPLISESTVAISYLFNPSKISFWLSSLIKVISSSWVFSSSFISISCHSGRPLVTFKIFPSWFVVESFEILLSAKPKTISPLWMLSNPNPPFWNGIMPLIFSVNTVLSVFKNTDSLSKSNVKW